MKLPLLIVLTALCIAVAAGSVASWSFYSGARRMIEANLTIIARSKRDQVMGTINTARQDLLTAVGNPSVQRSLDQLAIGFKILSPEDRSRLRDKYSNSVSTKTAGQRGIADYYGSAYDSINSWFRSFAQDHDLTDISFVDRDGNIAYSLAKTDDFGTNVHSGGLKRKSLATVFNRLTGRSPDSTITTDYEAVDTNSSPVSLSAAPVFQKLGSMQDFVGVLIFQRTSARIDAILNQQETFSGSGEVVIVGRDGLLRSNSRFGDRSDILHTRLNEPALTTPGPAGIVANTKAYRGLNMIAAAAPLSVGDFEWSVVAAESTNEVFRPVHQMIASIVGICIAATLLLAVISAAVARRMTRPIIDLVARFDAALSNMPHGLVMVDDAGRLILCNEAFQRMYGLPEELIVMGTPIARIAERVGLGGSGADASGSASRAFQPSGPDQHATDCFAPGDGRTIDVTRNPLATGGYVATHQDRTEAVQAQEQIRHLATHDALTGLPNRAKLRDRMNEALGRIVQGGSLAVLCLDLDHFKAVNDTLGHPIGDLLLKAVTKRLLACLNETDTLARLGGDEFVILKSGVASPAEAGDLARQLIDEVTAPFELDGHQLVIGMSVGISFAPNDGSDVDSLIKNADMALYRAKADGRCSARFFEPDMDAKLQDRRRLELDLRHALATEQFWLSYQPLFDSQTEQMTSVEALLRWQHPERGTISPVDFIPIAEEMGLIIPLGEWVIRKACLDAVEWPSRVKVAVNLSPAQFKSPTLVHTVVAALSASGLSPFRLELEITESVLLSDNDSTLTTLHQLRSLGVQIAMDDFGTGYSSLSYLRSFPFDKIKIDRSFIRGLSESGGAVAIIRAISELGSSLGMATTAEGIETVEQLQMVREQGCTEVQGYLFCRPIPASEITRMLQDGESTRRIA